MCNIHYYSVTMGVGGFNRLSKYLGNAQFTHLHLLSKVDIQPVYNGIITFGHFSYFL